MSDFYENFRKQALEKLDREYKAGKYGNKENAMKSAVRDALRNFCEQDGEFAQAVAQGGSFEDCKQGAACLYRRDRLADPALCPGAAPARFRGTGLLSGV